MLCVGVAFRMVILVPAGRVRICAAMAATRSACAAGVTASGHALTGETVQHARRALDVLAHAHLIQPVAPGRYGMHDLLRGYARELSATVDAEECPHSPALQG